jgi:hypothetical protein
MTKMKIYIIHRNTMIFCIVVFESIVFGHISCIKLATKKILVLFSRFHSLRALSFDMHYIKMSICVSSIIKKTYSFCLNLFCTWLLGATGEIARYNIISILHLFRSPVISILYYMLSSTWSPIKSQIMARDLIWCFGNFVEHQI